MFSALNILILILYRILDFHFLDFSIERKFIIITVVIISFSGFFFNVRRFWHGYFIVLAPYKFIIVITHPSPTPQPSKQHYSQIPILRRQKKMFPVPSQINGITKRVPVFLTCPNLDRSNLDQLQVKKGSVKRH